MLKPALENRDGAKIIKEFLKEITAFVGGRVVRLHSWRPKRKPLKIRVVEK